MLDIERSLGQHDANILTKQCEEGILKMDFEKPLLRKVGGKIQ